MTLEDCQRIDGHCLGDDLGVVLKIGRVYLTQLELGTCQVVVRDIPWPCPMGGWAKTTFYPILLL